MAARDNLLFAAKTNWLQVQSFPVCGAYHHSCNGFWPKAVKHWRGVARMGTATTERGPRERGPEGGRRPPPETRGGVRAASTMGRRARPPPRRAAPSARTPAQSAQRAAVPPSACGRHFWARGSTLGPSGRLGRRRTSWNLIGRPCCAMTTRTPRQLRHRTRTTGWCWEGAFRASVRGAARRAQGISPHVRVLRAARGAPANQATPGRPPGAAARPQARGEQRAQCAVRLRTAEPRWTKTAELTRCA